MIHFQLHAASTPMIHFQRRSAVASASIWLYAPSRAPPFGTTRRRERLHLALRARVGGCMVNESAT